ncbi:MAG: hypothetical protein ACXV3E_03065 [Halobacteriota archaeon]
MKSIKVFSIALVVMLLAVVSSVGVVTAQEVITKPALTPYEMRMQGLSYIEMAMNKLLGLATNPTQLGQIELTQPITMLLTGTAMLAGSCVAGYMGDNAVPVGN